MHVCVQDSVCVAFRNSAGLTVQTDTTLLGSSHVPKSRQQIKLGVSSHSWVKKKSQQCNFTTDHTPSVRRTGRFHVHTHTLTLKQNQVTGVLCFAKPTRRPQGDTRNNWSSCPTQVPGHRHRQYPQQAEMVWAAPCRTPG